MSYTTDVLEEHIRKLEAKLEVLRNTLNDHPKNGKAQELINRLWKVLNE